MTHTNAHYLAQIAAEVEANKRAQLDLYASAAHKEMYANERAKAEGWVDNPITGQSAVSAKEEDANRRAALDIDPRTGAKFVSAAAKEDYANAEAVRAGFTSAVDQEIDANRRARDAGWLNAADLELYGPEGATRVDPLKFPFVDPRDEVWTGPPPQYHIDTANDIEWNPDQPDHPDYDPNWRNDPKWAAIYGDDASANIKGEAGSMDLLSYRPGSQKYWDTYLPKNTGLMDMNLPPPEYSLAYAPGEWLAPKTWRDVIDAPGDQMRDIPQGAWRYATYKPSAYNEAGYPKQGISATTADLNMPGWPTRMPWQFTSPAMRTNIAQQPWSAKQLNISPTQGEAWQGLLTGLGTAPAIDTIPLSLLGVA